MKGFAIVLTPNGAEKVPHESDDSTGLVPQTTADGRGVWKWSSNEAHVDLVIEKRAEFRRAKGSTSSAAATGESTSRKGGRK